VHLISDGRDTQLYKGALCGAQFQGIDGTGANILFTTDDPVVPSDIDGVQRDIYDARINGGFAPVPSGEAGDCGASTCEGPSSSALALSVTPTSAGQSGEARLPAPIISARVKKSGHKKAGSTGKSLRAALRACHGKPKDRRAACERGARRRHGSSAKAKRSRGIEG
jgi:hypothetical protein